MTEVNAPIEAPEINEADLTDETDIELDEVTSKPIDGNAQVKAKSNRGNTKGLNRKLSQELIATNKELAIEITSTRILDAFQTLDEAQHWLAECWETHEQKRFARVDSLTGDLSDSEKRRLFDQLKAELQPARTRTTKAVSA